MSFSTKPRKRVSVDFSEAPSLTEQSHKDSCDIHYILRKSVKTGILEHVNANEGVYGTMPTGQEFHQHMNIIAAAETMFETVPSSIRNRFDNSPAKYLDYIQDPKNRDEMAEMGLDTSHFPPEKPIIEPELAPKTEPEPAPKTTEKTD